MRAYTKMAVERSLQTFAQTSPPSLSLLPQRPQQKILWLKTLREHLSSHVIPTAISQGLSVAPQSLQDSVLSVLSSPAIGGSCTPTRQTLPLDSEISTVKSLKEVKRSFRGFLRPQPETKQSSNDGGLVERGVVLVAVLTTSSDGGRDVGLCLRDSTAEIPCEVVPPIPCGNFVALLKKWTLVNSGSYGNYVEIEELVGVDKSCSLQQSLQGLSKSFLTIPDVLSLMKSEKEKELRDVNVVGRLSAVSEPFRNGPDLLLVLRICHTLDTSSHCLLLTQSPELMCLPRAMKLFEVYSFSRLKSAIMNKGKDDQATVLTTTAGTAVEYVSSDEEAVGDQFHHGSPDSMSPLRKKMKGDREGVAGGNQLNVGRLAADPVTRDTTSLSYRGVVTHCLLPEAGVYELDDRLTLYLTHSNLSNQGRGLREGAEVEISNAHVLRIANPFFKKMSGLVCCPVSRIEVVNFSKRDMSFKAFRPQNKLAHLLSKFTAMDVAWLTLIFRSLLRKFKKKREAFIVLKEVCEMVGVGKIHQDPHSSILRDPHSCPHLAPVDLSLRPLLPALREMVESCRQRAGSASFCWRGGREMGVATGGSAGAPAASAISVAVSTTWSFGAVESRDFHQPQLLVGRVCGNRLSGYLELCDETGSIPLVVCVPNSSAPDSDRESRNLWLSGVRHGSKVVIKEFTVTAERTEASEGTRDTKYSFYLHPHHFKLLEDDRAVENERQIVSTSGERAGGRSLYVWIKSKNCLKLGEKGVGSKCAFEALALAHSSLGELQSAGDTGSTPVTVVLGFTSARHYSFVHNHCTYRLSYPIDSQEKLPSLGSASKELHMTISDDVIVEMVALPRKRTKVQKDSVGSESDCLLEVGELVSMFHLPKLQKTFGAPQSNACQRSEDRLVSFRGVVTEHSYRIDCDSTHLLPWQLPAVLTVESRSMRQVVALTIRGLHCPNTATVYCKYKSHEPLPLGLVPGSIATFHHFSAKSSARSGNLYFVRSASSSITVESLRSSDSVASLRGRSHEEMLRLPVTYVSLLTERLLRGCLSREVVRVKATVVAVLHAFVQYQCLSCQCTLVDGQCRTTCPSKKSTLNTDARVLIEDGTGEAHLYVKGSDIPVALGMRDREWSDLLDLVHKLGQISYTKSSRFKCEKVSQPVTVKEKAEKMFLDVLTRPSVIRTLALFCQPFLSQSEQSIVLGSKTHRVWAKYGSEYVTLSLPRLQLRALAIATCDPLSLSHRLLTQLQT